jgi:hypothetical protein
LLGKLLDNDKPRVQLSAPSVTSAVVQVKLLDHYKMGSALILIFEFCASDLAQLLHNTDEPLEEGAVKGWFLQLLQGVDACHTAGIIHRVSLSLLCTSFIVVVGSLVSSGLESERDGNGQSDLE